MWLEREDKNEGSFPAFILHVLLVIVLYHTILFFYVHKKHNINRLKKTSTEIVINASFFTELCKNMYAHCITHNYDNIKFLIICQLDENDMSNDTFEQYK